MFTINYDAGAYVASVKHGSQYDAGAYGNGNGVGMVFVWVLQVSAHSETLLLDMW